MAKSSIIQRRPHLIPVIIVAVLLLGAMGNWPYDYYRVLRWVTCAAAIFTAYHAHAWREAWAIWTFGAIALLFNPFFPIHMKRDSWVVFDFISACLFCIAAGSLAAQEQPASQDAERHKS